MSVAGPGLYVEISGLTMTPITYATGSSTSSAISVYAVKSININHDMQTAIAYDNNKTRPVGVHAHTERQTVTIVSEDMTAGNAMETHKGQVVNLAWTGKIYQNQITTTPGAPADKAFTLGNVFVERVVQNQPSKATHSWTLEGFTLEPLAGDSTDNETIT